MEVSGFAVLFDCTFGFSRGDANDSGLANIADVIFMLQNLFIMGPPPDCLDAADVNDDGTINLGDPIYLLSFLFVYPSPPPPEPFDFCAFDPTDDALDCETFSSCP